MACNSSREYTLPVGFDGEQRMMARVAGVMAASRAAGSTEVAVDACGDGHGLPSAGFTISM